MQHNNFDEIKQKILSKDKKTLGKLITSIEQENSETLSILDEIYPEILSSFSVGITGPPGAGKSSLINRLVEQFKLNSKSEDSLAIIAVDPSSPFTGGAFLGDRIRLRAANAENIYVRSLASRGELGGLSPQTPEIIELLQATGFSLLFVETVGVGQSEVEIVKQADLTVVVLHPEAGDSVQALKAGLLEIADIIVINKADRPNAQDFRIAVENSLHLKTYGTVPPIFLTSAQTNQGIEEVYKKIISLYESKMRNPEFLKLYRFNKLRNRLKRRVMQFLVSKTFENEMFEEFVELTINEISSKTINFSDGINRLIEKIKTVL